MGEKICTDPMAEQQTTTLEQLVGKTERPLEGGTTPPGKDAEARLDTHDEVMSSLMGSDRRSLEAYQGHCEKVATADRSAIHFLFPLSPRPRRHGMLVGTVWI
jgi:hypothetical protein